MSNDKAWDDSEVYSASSFKTEHLLGFNGADTRGLSASGDENQLQWPVSWDQLRAWGAEEGSECSWRIEGPSLCWFIIDGRWVAKCERSADGSYSWTPQCTCLDDEDSGGNRFKDWDEDCPIHGKRAAANAEAR